MILTCPECATKYVVKDGAIPVGGRKVRCASCKHSWHQDPDDTAHPDAAPVAPPVVEHPGTQEEVVPNDEPYGWDNPPVDEASPPAIAENSATDSAGQDVADYASEATAGDFVTEDPPAPTHGEPAALAQTGDDYAVAREEQWADERVEDPAPVTPVADEEFEPFYPADEGETATRRRWPWVLLIILVLAGAAAAFWYLAPAGVKQQVGLAQSRSPLEVMGINQSRQALASGNDLFTVSGRIINPTDKSQPVPPLRAELLDKSKSKVLHSWMISPPVDTLPPNESRTFHSAEMDVPEGGEFIRVRLSTSG